MISRRRLFALLLLALTPSFFILPGDTALPIQVNLPLEASVEGPLSAFSFMSGRWTQVIGEGERSQWLEETWSPATGDAMVGMFRWARNDKVWLYEVMSLETAKDGPVLTLRHFNRGLEPWKNEAKHPHRWKLKSVEGQRAIFSAPKETTFGKITYERRKDSLHITLEADDGKTQAFHFKASS